MQAPIQTLTPGQQYVPGGTTYPSTTIPQGTTPPTYSNPGGGLEPLPDNGQYRSNSGTGATSAPSYNPSPGQNSAGGSGSVPDPYYPGGGSAMQMTPQNATSPNAIQPVGGMREIRGQNETISASRDEPWSFDASPAPATTSSEDFTLPRVGTAPASGSPTSSSSPYSAPGDWSDPFGDSGTENLKAHKVVAPETETFAHDPRMAWVRGVVSQHPQDGTWTIIFDDSPQAGGEFQGQITLAVSPHLEDLKDGDLVEIQGQVDTLAKDHRGKPVYIISRLNHLHNVRVSE